MLLSESGTSRLAKLLINSEIGQDNSGDRTRLSTVFANGVFVFVRVQRGSTNLLFG